MLRQWNNPIHSSQNLLMLLTLSQLFTMINGSVEQDKKDSAYTNHSLFSSSLHHLTKRSSSSNENLAGLVAVLMLLCVTGGVLLLTYFICRDKESNDRENSYSHETRISESDTSNFRSAESTEDEQTNSKNPDQVTIDIDQRSLRPC